MKATRLALFTLAFLATACTGTVAGGRGASVSSSLVEYLYPAGEKPPAPSRKIPGLPLPMRIGIAFVPSPHGPQQELSEAERFKLLYELKSIFSKRDFVEEVAVIGRPELTRLYAAAIAETGRSAIELDGERCFLAGIAEIAKRIS